MVDSLEAALLSAAVLGQIFVLILGIILLLRARNVYGDIREFLKDKLASLSLSYFVGAFLLMCVWWVPVVSKTVSQTLVEMFDIIFAILFIFNICWFYVTIIYRVYISFKNNDKYKLSRLELLCLALFVLWQLGFIIFLEIANLDRWEAAIIFIFVVCIDIAFNITILHVFLKRLYQMILSLDESFESLIVDMDEIRMNSLDETEHMHMGDDGDNNYHHDHDHLGSKLSITSGSDTASKQSDLMDRMHKIRIQETEVINIMAKISLLTIVSEIFINIFLSMVVFLNIDEANDHGTDVSDGYVAVEQLMLIIAVCINCFTLYATFVFNDDHYIKCCGLCHKSLKQCCLICVTRQSLRRRGH